MPLNRTFNRLGPLSLVALAAFGAAKNYKTDFPSLAEVDKKARAKEMLGLAAEDHKILEKNIQRKFLNLLSPKHKASSKKLKRYKAAQNKARQKFKIHLQKPKISGDYKTSPWNIFSYGLSDLNKEYKVEISDKKLAVLAYKNPNDPKVKGISDKYYEQAQKLRANFDKEVQKAQEIYDQEFKNYLVQDPSEAGEVESILLNHEANLEVFKFTLASKLGIKFEDIEEFEVLGKEFKPVKWYPEALHYPKLNIGEEGIGNQFAIVNFKVNDSNFKAKAGFHAFISLKNFEAIVEQDPLSYVEDLFLDDESGIVDDQETSPEEDYRRFMQSKASIIHTYKTQLQPLLTKNGERIVCIDDDDDTEISNTEGGSSQFYVKTAESKSPLDVQKVYLLKDGHLYIADGVYRNDGRYLNFTFATKMLNFLSNKNTMGPSTPKKVDPNDSQGSMTTLYTNSAAKYQFEEGRYPINPGFPEPQLKQN